MTQSTRRRIVLFHRMDLTLLFAGLADYLERDLDVIHLAYGPEEALRLREYNMTEGVTIFKEEICAVHRTVLPDQATLEEIDRLIIEETDGAFCLNSAIQSDRGFKLLDYDEALHLTVTYYTFWMRFIDENHIDFLLHEPCTLMFNFLPALILSRRGGAYLYNVMTPGHSGELSHLTMTGFDFTCPDLERHLAELDNGNRTVDISECEFFLTTFRNSYKVFLGDVLGRNVSLPRLAATAVVHTFRNLKNRSRYDRVLENIDYWSARRNHGLAKFCNVLAYRRYIVFDDIIPDELYFFYPLHLEPEAVVLYHGHGIYENQIKLVQNIAGQLPPDTWLYVKDHPHEIGYRSVDDYKKLKAIPNVRLLDSAIPGKEVIRNALGVITITGTSGFEALMLGKQVYTFGKTFYSASTRVTFVRHVRDLRAAVYARRNESHTDDNDLYRFLAAYLAALQPGLIDYFAGRSEKYGIDLDKNAKQVARNILASMAVLAVGN